MEEQYQRELENQLAHLECLQAEKDMDAAHARLEEIKQESVHQPIQQFPEIPGEPRTVHDVHSL